MSTRWWCYHLSCDAAGRRRRSTRASPAPPPPSATTPSTDSAGQPLAIDDGDRSAPEREREREREREGGRERGQAGGNYSYGLCETDGAAYISRRRGDGETRCHQTLLGTLHVASGLRQASIPNTPPAMPMTHRLSLPTQHGLIKLSNLVFDG